MGQVILRLFFLTEEHALGLQPKVVCACTPDACTVCACMQYVGLFCVMQRIKMASQARRTQVWRDREEEEDSKTASKFLSSCFVQIKSNTTELIFKDTFKDTRNYFLPVKQQHTETFATVDVLRSH